MAISAVHYRVIYVEDKPVVQACELIDGPHKNGWCTYQADGKAFKKHELDHSVLEAIRTSVCNRMCNVHNGHGETYDAYDCIDDLIRLAFESGERKWL